MNKIKFLASIVTLQKVGKLGWVKAGPPHRAGAAVRLNPLPKKIQELDVIRFSQAKMDEDVAGPVQITGRRRIVEA